jgi:hypothetical protein
MRLNHGIPAHPVTLLAACLFAMAGCATAPHPPLPSSSLEAQPLPAGILADYAARLPRLREQMPEFIRSAEVAAAFKLAASNAVVAVARQKPMETGFAAEFMARAGGLAEAGWANRGRRNRRPSILLASVRAWESDGTNLPALLAEQRGDDALVLLFASRAGRPPEAVADAFLDNGARSGGAAEAPLNALINVSAAWVWTCEYAAALTRLGKRPGILKSISFDDGQEFNAEVRANRGGVWDCATPVPAGVLGGRYLDRLDRMVGDLAAPACQTQIQYAADVIAARIRSGGPVFAATCTHLMKEEIRLDLASPFRPVSPYRGEMQAALQPGDLLIWLGYIGMDTARYQHGEAIRQTGADLIACFAPSVDETQNAPYALARILQPWELGDAEVSVPFPPGRMAPISGVLLGLQYRMLDAAVAARLTSEAPP